MTRRKIMNEQQKVELELIHMEDVVSKEVEWLWYPYIPYKSSKFELKTIFFPENLEKGRVIYSLNFLINNS